MSASDDIKEQLEEVFGLDKWKRTVKATIANGVVLRQFTNAGWSQSVYAFSFPAPDGRTVLYNGTTIIFGVAEDNGELVVMFAEPYEYAQQNIDPLLPQIFPLISKTPPAYLQLGANPLYWWCDASVYTRPQLIKDIEAGGFTFDPIFDKDFNLDYDN